MLHNFLSTLYRFLPSQPLKLNSERGKALGTCGRGMTF